MTDQGRRYTDREVALVLKKATELEVEPTGHGGTSLDDLKGIAHEVGISPDALDRAVASLDARAPAARGVFGPRGVRKAVRAVPSELGQDEMGRLIRVVDQRAAHTGTVTEALGSVRWMGRDRFKSTQVSITPTNGETVIEVVEKAEAVHRYGFQLLPAAWSVIASMPAIAEFGIGGVAIVGVAAVAGLGLGRLFWNRLERTGQSRVKALAQELDSAGRALTP